MDRFLYNRGASVMKELKVNKSNSLITQKKKKKIRFGENLSRVLHNTQDFVRATSFLHLSHVKISKN